MRLFAENQHASIDHEYGRRFPVRAHLQCRIEVREKKKRTAHELCVERGTAFLQEFVRESIMVVGVGVRQSCTIFTRNCVATLTNGSRFSFRVHTFLIQN